MNTTRLNITLPNNVAKILKDKKSKSSYIAEAIVEKAEHEKHQRLIEDLKKAYQASASEDRELQKSWDKTLGDGLD